MTNQNNRKRTSIFLSAVLFLIVALMMVACVDGQATKQQSRQVNAQMDHYGKVQPVDFYDFSLERSFFNQIYDVRVRKAVNTWTVWRSEGTGRVEDWCPSVGYGLPYDLQLTNPLQIADAHYDVVLEQAEPNGLYSSDTTKATWVLCRVPFQDEPLPVYVESTVTTYPWRIEVVNGEVVHYYDETSDVGIDTSTPNNIETPPTPTPALE